MKVAPKKKGGLKFTSKLDAKKAPPKPIAVEKSPVKEEEKKQVEAVSFAFDGFDMGAYASSSAAASPNEMFSFGGGFEEHSSAAVNLPEQSPAS